MTYSPQRLAEVTISANDKLNYYFKENSERKRLVKTKKPLGNDLLSSKACRRYHGVNDKFSFAILGN